MKTPQSFRRQEPKVIADGKDQKDQLSAQEVLNNSVNGVKDTVAEHGTRQEDAVWTTGEMIVDGVNDVSAGTELVAENTEETNSHLKDLKGINSEISEKLSAFSDMLKANLTNGISTLPAPLQSSIPEAETVIDDEIPEPQPIPEIPQLLPDPVRKPEDDVNPEQEAKDKARSDKIDEILAQLGMLNKSVAGGFKQSIAFSDKIASMLFKYTLTAVANMAKTAAIVLSIIMAIDLLNTHFSYWGEKLSAGMASLQTEMGSLAQPFGTIKGTMENILKYLDSGEIGNAIKESLSGLLQLADDLAGSVLYGIGNMTVALLRAMGMNNVADSVQSANAQFWAQSSGHRYTEEEKQAIANTQKDSFVEDNMGKTRTGGWLNMAMPDKDLASLRASKRGGSKEDQEKYYQEELKKINDEKNIDTSPENVDKMLDQKIRLENEASAVSKDMDRFKTNPEQLAILQKSIDAMREELKTTKTLPKVEADLTAKIDELQQRKDKYAEENNNRIKPGNPIETVEGQASEKIHQADQAKAQATQAAPVQPNVSVNNVKSSKTTNVSVGHVRTSIDAPGMGSSRTV
ncbi:tape measure protein [Serratia phage 4S]|nr:tape measure protein [Serratia phage 4S]